MKKGRTPLRLTGELVRASLPGGLHDVTWLAVAPGELGDALRGPLECGLGLYA